MKWVPYRNPFYSPELVLEGSGILTPFSRPSLEFPTISLMAIDEEGTRGKIPSPGRSVSNLNLANTNPFSPLFTTRHVTGRELFDALKAKHPMRNLLQGGPIRQPDFFIAFKQDKLTLSRMRKKYAQEAFEDLSCPEQFSSSSGLQDFQSVMDSILAGDIALPVIYKPNRSARGVGIFFLEKASGGRLLLTMAYDKSGYWYGTETKAVSEYFSRIGVRAVKNGNKGTMQITFNPKRANASEVLYDIWTLISANYMTDQYGSYDAGTLETVIPAFKYHGKAFETRHRFGGNLLSDQVILKKMEKRGEEAGPMESYFIGPNQWFARLGNSAYFTNDHDIRWPGMFQPMYEAFGIPKKSHQQFEAYISDLISAEFRYLTNRLKAGGVGIDTLIDGEFDLMWLPPEKDGNKLPIPVLIEASIHPTDAAVFDQKLPNRVISSDARGNPQSKQAPASRLNQGARNSGLLRHAA